MSGLLTLMHELGRDAALARRYEGDPETVMRQAGLSAEERHALTNRDHAAIVRLTGADQPAIPPVLHPARETL